MYKIMRIDPRSVTAETITFADGTLTINVPQRTFYAGCVYFLRLVDPIPAATTVNAPVVITVGDGTVEYPLVACNGAQVTVGNIRTGYSYPIRLATTATGGSFRVLDRLWGCAGNALGSVDGTAPVEGGAGA